MYRRSPCLCCVQVAVDRCATGQSTKGLTVELNNMLHILYERFACDVYAKACEGYNLQSLYWMYRNNPSRSDLLHEYTRTAVGDLCALSIESLQERRDQQVCDNLCYGLPSFKAFIPACIVFCLFVQASVSVICEADWSWSPLPFYYHIKSAAKSELASLRMAGGDPSPLSVRAILAPAFPKLIPRGRILDLGEGPDSDFLQDATIAAVARR